MEAKIIIRDNDDGTVKLETHFDPPLKKLELEGEKPTMAAQVALDVVRYINSKKIS